MAKATKPSTKESHSIKRPGVYAKSKTSKLKTSKNCKKPYKGQGK